MVHQFDNRSPVYIQCLQHQSVQQQQHASHRQSVTATHQYTTGVPPASRSSASDYVMYSGNGNTVGGGDIAARSPTSTCRRHHVMSYVRDAADQTNQHHHPQQQHVYYTNYNHHRLGSKYVREDGQTGRVATCWAYPSVTGEADTVEDSPAGWLATTGRLYGGYMSGDDSLDPLHHQLLNPDTTSLSDNVYVCQAPSSDIPDVTTATCQTSKYRLQPEPDAVGAAAVAKQHSIDIVSRVHHVQAAGESAWTQSEPAFDWMKKHVFSPVTPTGMHGLLLC